LVTPQIEWIKTGFTCSPSLEWSEIISKLTEDDKRNRLALEVVMKALDDGRRVIALSERMAHVERLAGTLNRIRPGAAVLAHGRLGKKAREEAIQKISSGEAKVLFATKLGDEGLDIAALDALVLLTPSRDGGRTMQRVGRILRALPGKRAPVVFDLVDAGVGLLANQARARFFTCYRHLSPGARLPNWIENRREGDSLEAAG
jgi:superfamily II DNA or RNA helicase